MQEWDSTLDGGAYALPQGGGTVIVALGHPREPLNLQFALTFGEVLAVLRANFNVTVTAQAPEQDRALFLSDVLALAIERKAQALLWSPDVLPTITQVMTLLHSAQSAVGAVVDDPRAGTNHAYPVEDSATGLLMPTWCEPDLLRLNYTAVANLYWPAPTFTHDGHAYRHIYRAGFDARHQRYIAEAQGLADALGAVGIQLYVDPRLNIRRIYTSVYVQPGAASEVGHG